MSETNAAQQLDQLNGAAVNHASETVAHFAEQRRLEAETYAAERAAQRTEQERVAAIQIRAAALQQALLYHGPTTSSPPEDIVGTAATFEAFLRGEG